MTREDEWKLLKEINIQKEIKRIKRCIINEEPIRIIMQPTQNLNKKNKHQICEEIRKFITENGFVFYTEFSTETEEVKHRTMQHNEYLEEILMFLDKIEKGEEK